MSVFVFRAPFAATLLASAAPLWAQSPSGDAPPAIPAPVNGAERYTPADFARFAPRTALDMVERCRAS